MVEGHLAFNFSIRIAEGLIKKLSIMICCTTEFHWFHYLVLCSGFFLNGDPRPTLCSVVLKWRRGRMVIKLTFKRGQCIELSPQQGAQAWPELESWHGYRTWQWNPSSGCCRVCRFCQARAGREMWVFMTGVPRRTILLRQDLLTQCHPLPPTVHMVMLSLLLNIGMTRWQCGVLLDWPVSWRKDVLSASALEESSYRCVQSNSFLETVLNKLKLQFSDFSGVIIHQKKYLQNIIDTGRSQQGNVTWFCNLLLLTFFSQSNLSLISISTW